MQSYDKITIIRNRHRAGEIRRFRDRVEAYFEQFDYDVEGLPVDWQGARNARSQINQMLPRIIQVVEAAQLPASARLSHRTRPVEVLDDIFSERYADGDCQEILDVLDMALGVYDANQFNAFFRTINPFYYAFSLLGFVARLPGRLLAPLAFWRRPNRKVTEDDVSRLEAATARLASVEELIERRFTEMRDWQTRKFADHEDNVTDLAERMDFAERMLTRGQADRQLDAPDPERVVTPV